MKLLILFVLVFLCGLNALPANRIINPISQSWVHHVCLIYADYQHPNLVYLGGGSILTERHILTAAHLVYKSRKVTIGFGARTASAMQIREATNIIVHNYFKPAPTDFDIAIIILSEAHKIMLPPGGLVMAATLPPLDGARTAPELGITGQVAGFGFASDQQDTINSLNVASLTVINNKPCEDAYGNRTLPNYFCAQDTANNPPSNVCPGDNGNGFYTTETGPSGTVRVLFGITSFIPTSCTDTPNPAGFIRIAIFRDWIENIIGE